MEAQAALVRADGAVELDAVAAVDLHLALIIDPGHTEADDALGLDQTLDQAGFFVLGVLLHHGLDALQNLADCLQKLRLIGIALCKAIVNALQVFIRQHNRILLFLYIAAVQGQTHIRPVQAFSPLRHTSAAEHFVIIKLCGAIYNRGCANILRKSFKKTG